jgi:DNA-binding transcriptional LysR family regulator
MDDQELMVEAALQGCGLAYVWDNRVIAHLQKGALIRFLDDWCAFDDGLFLYYPSRKYLSVGLRTLIDSIRAVR